MSIYKSFKKAVTSTVDMVIDRTASQAQKSRLVTVMKTEEKTANRLYIQLGQYLYSNLRDSVPEDIALLCGRIDESKERMSRAQTKYRETVQQELISREISKAEAKVNFEKIKEPIVAKAKDTAVKVKDTAADTADRVKNDTAVKVDELKRAAAEKASEIKLGKQKTAVVETGVGVTSAAAAEETAATEEINNSIIEVTEEADVEEAISEAVEAVETADSTAAETSVSSYEPVSKSTEPEILTYEPLAQAAAEPIVPITMETESPISTEPSASSEAASEEEDPTPEDKPIDQEFQRSVPVDIISETEFEKDEPEVRPLDKTNPLAKAMKLRKIINKKNEEE